MCPAWGWLEEPRKGEDQTPADPWRGSPRQAHECPHGAEWTTDLEPLTTGTCLSSVHYQHTVYSPRNPGYEKHQNQTGIACVNLQQKSK